MQQKYKESLDVLDGDLGKKLDETTSFLNLVNTKRLDYLKKLGKWQQVNLLIKSMLVKDPDQWNFYQDYITSVFHILDDNLETFNGVDQSIDDAFSFILAQKKANDKCRGPSLAQLELSSRLVARRDPKSSDG